MNKTKSRTISHAHLLYVEEGGTLSASTFRTICSRFNILAMDRILEGEVLHMGHGLSNLRIVKVKTNFRKPKIDWHESNKLRDKLIKEGKTPYDKKNNPDGVKWFVYFLNEWFCKFHWSKKYCVVPNQRVYRFEPSRGAKGNKEKLIKLLKEDETAILRFPRLRKDNDKDYAK